MQDDSGQFREPPLKAGKLPLALLSRLLGQIDASDPRVLLGPKPGADAAVIDLGDRCLVAATDPITFATDLIGWYAVQINANDVAVMGAKPLWMMATLLLPQTTSAEQVQQMFDQLRVACGTLGITLIGGHTEVTQYLPRPIVVGAMLGEVSKERLVLSGGALPGDTIVLTGGIAIEGTALLAREAAAALSHAGVDDDSIHRAAGSLFSHGICVLNAAEAACDAVSVHAMHDPTEGGLATGLLELAEAAGAGLVVDDRHIPVLPECSAICEALALDPLGLLASGALLLTIASSDAPALIAALKKQGISAQEIGTVTEQRAGVKIRTHDGLIDLPRFDRDELARFFDSRSD